MNVIKTHRNVFILCGDCARAYSAVYAYAMVFMCMCI